MLQTSFQITKNFKVWEWLLESRRVLDNEEAPADVVQDRHQKQSFCKNGQQKSHAILIYGFLTCFGSFFMSFFSCALCSLSFAPCVPLFFLFMSFFNSFLYPFCPSFPNILPWIISFCIFCSVLPRACLFFLARKKILSHFLLPPFLSFLVSFISSFIPSFLISVFSKLQIQSLILKWIPKLLQRWVLKRLWFLHEKCVDRHLLSLDTDWLSAWVCFCAALENQCDTCIVPKQTNPRTSGLSIAGLCTVSFAKPQHKSEASGGSCVSLPTSLSNNVRTSRFKSLCLHTHAVLTASNRRTTLHCLHSRGWWQTKDEHWQHAASHFSCFHIPRTTTNLGTGLKSLWWSGRDKYDNKCYSC